MFSDGVIQITLSAIGVMLAFFSVGFYVLTEIQRRRLQQQQQQQQQDFDRFGGFGDRRPQFDHPQTISSLFSSGRFLLFYYS
jgi:hypothetical protein